MTLKSDQNDSRRGIVMRWGELFLKGQNRGFFVKVFKRNVETVLKRCGADFCVSRRQGRLYVDVEPKREVVEGLRRVFGASSISPVWYARPDRDALRDMAVHLAVEKRPPGVRTFRITTRRVDKSFEINSTRMNTLIGESVRLATGLGVDLENPDFNIGVEIAGDRTFVFSEKIRGAGGLPTGVSGKGLLMLSGGIDSPVAGWLAQKRGLYLSAVHFHSFPYTSEASQKKVIELAHYLGWQQKNLELYMVPFAKVQERLKNRVQREMLVVLYRRSMMRIASALAQRLRAQCLVTGESLGQVASQTLQNMASIEKASTLSIIRPLITYDKSETIEIARNIGSFEVSVQPHDDACSVFVPRHPATRTEIENLQEEEEKADVTGLEKEVLDNSECIRPDFSDKGPGA